MWWLLDYVDEILTYELRKLWGVCVCVCVCVCVLVSCERQLC